MSHKFNVHRGFPEAARLQVAALYDVAFGSKLGIAIPDSDLRLKVLAEAFDPSHSFVAISGTRLLGVAGFETRKSSLTSGISPRLLRTRLGIIGAIRAVTILALFQRRLSPNQLLMDGICVSP